VDTQAPNITCPKDIEQTAPKGLAQVIVNFPAPYATDNDQVWPGGRNASLWFISRDVILMSMCGRHRWPTSNAH
jgi:hypothetical protein